MDFDNFLWFIEERERIRRCKENQDIPPWTEDTILDNTHFLNIHFEDDPGTIRLHLFIDGMTGWEKLFYIFTYRTVYSSPEFLNDLAKIWFHDFRTIQTLKLKHYSDRQPYSFHFGKHSSIDQFLINVSLNIQKRLWESFSKINNATILELEEVITFLFSIQFGRQYKLLSSIISRDISLQFPGKINPESECSLSVSARQALNKMGGGRSSKKMEVLLHLTGLKYPSLCRALDEYYKYTVRERFYSEKGYLREEWLIHSF